MKQILLAIDDETARQLDAVAPARSRRRSEFVRMAIRKTLWELQERQTAEAYARMPDGEEAYFDPTVWERTPRPARRTRPRRR